MFLSASQWAKIFNHPQWPLAERIYQQLDQKGYICFLAGGCIRDALLDKEPKDLDIVTNAKPEDVAHLFPKTLKVGESFGIMVVVDQGQQIEVASFRKEYEYQDGRRPSRIEWGTPEEDAQRRDFTVNALFYDLKNQTILDFVSGLIDIKNRVLRTVGDADQRFQEDHLRLLRAVRFVGQLGFQLESSTAQAIRKNIVLASQVSGERIRDEMQKLFFSSESDRGLLLFAELGFLSVLFPELTGPLQEISTDLPTHVWEKLFPLAKADSLSGWLAFFIPWCHQDPTIWKNILARLKLPRQLSQDIQSGLRFATDFPQFVCKNKAEKILVFHDPARKLAFWLLSLLTDSAKMEFEKMSLISPITLPKAFLSGDDARGLLLGKDIGEALKQAYYQQLEGNLQSREQALNWLQNHACKSKKS